MCSIAPHLYPRGKFVSRQGQSLFHEAGRLPSPQQMDERGIPALPTAKRLGGAEKRCSEGILPADLCGMCEIGGVIRCHFLRTPESLWGLAGKIMVAMMNLGHSPVARWGLHFLELTLDAKVLDCGCGGRGEHQETSEKIARRVLSRALTIPPSVWRNPKRSTRPP